MNCKHCSKDFTPKQLFCSAKCRVYSHRNVTVTKGDKLTNSSLKAMEVLQDDKLDELRYKIATAKKIGKKEAKEAYGMCKKHNVFYSSCHC